MACQRNPSPMARLLGHVGAEQLVGVADAVHVGALVVVRGVDARADEPVSDVEAGRERGLDVGAVVRVDVDGLV